MSESRDESLRFSGERYVQASVGARLQVELETVMMKLRDLGALAAIEEMMPAMHKSLARIYRDANDVLCGFKEPEITRDDD